MWHLHKRNQISITSSSDIISAFISAAVFAVNPHPSSLSLHLHHNEVPPPAQQPCLVPPEQTGPTGTFHLPPSPSFSFHALPLPWDFPSAFWTLPLPDPLRPPPLPSGPSPTCCLPVSLASVGRMRMGANPYAQFFPFFLPPTSWFTYPLHTRSSLPPAPQLMTQPDRQFPSRAQDHSLRGNGGSYATLVSDHITPGSRSEAKGQVRVSPGLIQSSLVLIPTSRLDKTTNSSQFLWDFPSSRAEVSHPRPSS